MIFVAKKTFLALLPQFGTAVINPAKFSMVNRINLA